jgi:hypothetical protein
LKSYGFVEYQGAAESDPPMRIKCQCANAKRFSLASHALGESEYRPSLGAPAMHEICDGAEHIHPRVEADLHGDGHPDVGGRVLDAGAMRQEGFHNTAAKSELAAG